MVEDIKKLAGPMIIYFVLVWIGEGVLGFIWHEPQEALMLLFKGDIIKGLITIFLSWVMYTSCAGTLIMGESKNDVLAGVILFGILAFMWSSDLKEIMEQANTIGSKATNGFIYAMVTFTDVLQLAGFVSAVYYRNDYLRSKHEEISSNESANDDLNNKA